MGVLCFGSYARLLKEATATTNEFLFETLFGAFPNSVDVDITNKSKLLNSKMNVPIPIQNSADTPAVIDTIETYFQKSVIIHIKQAKLNSLIALLVGLINGDANIPDVDKTNFLAKSNVPQLASFLSIVFLYAIQQPNNLKANPLPVAVSDNSAISLIAGRLYLDGQEISMPDTLTPPDNFDDHEALYIKELLRAYAEAERVPSITANAIPSKYQEHFNRQRQDYFNAEAVRRRVREISVSANAEFDVFKKDVYDGIIDVHAQSHSNAYQRLLAVLVKATSLPQGKSLLERLPKWISSSEKKGACHILVNDGKITWVVEE